MLQETVGIKSKQLGLSQVSFLLLQNVLTEFMNKRHSSRTFYSSDIIGENENGTIRNADAFIFCQQCRKRSIPWVRG